jgi:hypothetical protein
MGQALTVTAGHGAPPWRKVVIVPVISRELR